MTHFKSRTYEGMVFVDLKSYLLPALLMYVASIYLCDVAADYVAYYVEGALRDLFYPPSWRDHTFGWVTLVRRVLFGELLPFFLFFLLPTFFFKPDTLFFYAGFRKFHDEYLLLSFTRVVRDIFISSIIIILLMGCLQGFFFWINWGYGLYLELVHPEILAPARNDAETLEIINQQLAWLKHFNLSILFISLIRSGILVTIIRGLLYNDKRARLVPAKKIIPFIAVALAAAVMLIPQKITYVPKPPKPHTQFMDTKPKPATTNKVKKY